nr:hypothetical protein IUWQDXFC_IUWQDXFC_CDS_0005 [Microvirus sp.]
MYGYSDARACEPSRKTFLNISVALCHLSDFPFVRKNGV